MEFQAVVLAAGQGQRMMELTKNMPKLLLPVANKPLVWYTLAKLKQAGFDKAIVTVLESHRILVESTLARVGTCDVDVTLVTVPDQEDWGTANTLRSIAAKIKHDLVVVSCDLITDIPLHKLADIHRIHDATFTALLAAPSCTQQGSFGVPGPKVKREPERDIIGLEAGGERLVFMGAQADYEDSVTFPLSLMKNFPRVQVNTKYLDAHLYIIKKSVLKYLEEHRTLSTLKGEVLPRVVRRQHRCISANKGCPSPSPHSPPDTHHPGQRNTEEEEDSLTQAAALLSSGGGQGVEELSDTQCFAYVAHEGLCIRVNTVAAYCHANRQAARLLECFDPDANLVRPSASVADQSVISGDSVVGEGAKVGRRVTLKRSVVGTGCTIADECKLTNCVLMDCASVESGCQLTGCIVGERVRIGAGCDLKDCIITARHHVPSQVKASNEVIGDSGFKMEM